MFSLLLSPSLSVHFLSCLSLYRHLPVPPSCLCFVRVVACWCACVCMYCWYPIPSPYFPTLDYAEQLRIMQKTKDKLEIALEKQQDCTYLYSPPNYLLLSHLSVGCNNHHLASRPPVKIIFFIPIANIMDLEVCFGCAECFFLLI